MITMTLEEIAIAIGGKLSAGAQPATTVTGPLSFDSRNVYHGGLFACLPGKLTDGHNFAQSAIDAGAVAVLASHEIDGVPAVIVPNVISALSDLARTVAQKYKGTIIAITGSVGKTSTKDLLLQILSTQGSTVANERSFNNEIGFPATVLRVEEDTKYLIVEMGARGKGHIAQLSELVNPTCGAVIGVGSAHLGEFGTKANIAGAKRELVESLQPSGIAVLNADDPLVMDMREHTSAKTITFGTSAFADVNAHDITVGSDGRASFTLSYGDHHAALKLGVVGEHHIINALAAAAIALGLGVPFQAVAKTLQGAHLLSGSRMEVVEGINDSILINDAFNASPESVHAALHSLSTIAKNQGRKSVAILGEMKELGNAAAKIHEEVGHLVSNLKIDHLITVGGHNAELVSTAARRTGTQVDHAPDKEAIMPMLNRILSGNEVILIKGANSTRLFDLVPAITGK